MSLFGSLLKVGESLISKIPVVGKLITPAADIIAPSPIDVIVVPAVKSISNVVETSTKSNPITFMNTLSTLSKVSDTTVKVAKGTAVAGAVTLGATAVTGFLLNTDKPIQQLSSLTSDTYSSTYKISSDLAKGNFKEAAKDVGTFISDHPIASSIAAAVTVTAVGKAVAPAVINLLSVEEQKKNINKLADSVKEKVNSTSNTILPESTSKAETNIIPMSKSSPVADSSNLFPVINQTQSLTTYRRRKYKAKPKIDVPRNTVRVNIFNQSRLNNAKYIKN